jgi:hypothetical protein
VVRICLISSSLHSAVVQQQACSQSAHMMHGPHPASLHDAAGRCTGSHGAAGVCGCASAVPLTCVPTLLLSALPPAAPPPRGTEAQGTPADACHTLWLSRRHGTIMGTNQRGVCGMA